jgi:Carboxypeptidase regulatory-like domain
MTRIRTLLLSSVLLALCPVAIYAQETRGTIHGRILDPTGAAVQNASVLVENVEMNTATRLSTNPTGYYEATLLLAGTYRISAEIAGFKKIVRTGLVLPMSGVLDVDLTLEVGGVSETVSVTAQAPVLDTSVVSSGRVLDNRSVMDLPTIANNTMVLVKLTPGIFTGGVNDYLGPHSISGASDYSTGAGVGGNEWSIDGVPSNGASRQTAYLPSEDTVQEMRVETSNFDASVGHGTLANITMMTRAGTNAYHGTLTEQHWQQRWQGTNFFARQQYFNSIAAAEAGNHALADQIRHTDKQAPGRSNNYVGTIGGPVRIPKVYNGSDRLFFFFSYQGNKDQVVDLPARINTTLPTMLERKGDFSRYLQIDPVRYQIYDPLSVQADPARAGHFIRQPFAGNIIPPDRISNPAYNAYLKLFPATNNEPAANRDPTNDYLSNAPLIRDYAAYGNRVDFQASNKSRFFARWTYNHWSNYAADWTYTTLKGLQSLAQIRKNFGATLDWTYAATSNTILDVAIAANDYQDGNNPATALGFKPSDMGFPAYMDQKAGDQHIMPQITFATGGYNAVSTTYPVVTHYRTTSSKADLTHIRGNHTARAGFDMRMQYRTGGGGGNTSGAFTFSNTYTRRNEDTFTPAGVLGLSWAAFMMGFPDTMQIAYADTYAMLNPYFAWYAQDSWRLSRKLNVNFGLRIEYEMGPTERYNRMLAGFDPTAKLPITDAAQAAYARSPIPELSAANFLVQGGTLYAGNPLQGRQLWRNQLMWLPRLAAAYTVTPKTVVRLGYGLFYDTLNVLNEGPDQTGYSRTTSTTVTNDFGQTWLAGNPRAGISPMADPFPVRADGTRFDVPTGNALGLMAKAGRGWTYTDYDYQHARLQRWRAGVQRQLGGNMVLEAAYVGERAADIPLSHSLSYLPAQYWSFGTVRDNNTASNMTQNVTNPFRITNFSALQTSDPAQYANLNTIGYFTSATIQKNSLLRAFPELNGLTQRNAPAGSSRTDALQVTLQRRFAKGFNLNVGYTRMRARTADIFSNEFDVSPTWRESNDARPHRLVAGGIYELPFGKGRPFAKTGILNHVLGGFQMAATYEWEPGALLDFGNLYYYGKLDDIRSGPHTLDEWFNTDNFERTSTKLPAQFQARVFPTHVDGVRADMTNQWNTNIQREFRLKERVRFQIRVDALNLQNRTQFAAPNVNPASTDFGRVTAQSNTTKRFIQLQARLRF